MDTPRSEKLTLIGAALVLVASMLQVALISAENSRAVAKTISGDDDEQDPASAAPTCPPGVDLCAPTPVPATPAPSGLEDFGSVGNQNGPSGGGGGGPAPKRPANPGPAVPYKAGKYKYVSTDGQADYEVEVVSVGDGRFTEKAQGADQEIQWDAAQKVVLSGTYGQGEMGATCNDWNPDVLQYAFPMSVGAKWERESTCRATANDGTQVRFAQTMRSEVLSATLQSVAGNDVDTWEIRVLTAFRVTDAETGQITYFQYSTGYKDYFAPAYGLTARLETEEGVFVLQSLEPAK